MINYKSIIKHTICIGLLCSTSLFANEALNSTTIEKEYDLDKKYLNYNIIPPIYEDNEVLLKFSMQNEILEEKDSIKELSSNSIIEPNISNNRFISIVVKLTF